VHVKGGSAQFDKCRFDGNVAEMVNFPDGGQDASGGGISVDANGRLTVLDSVFLSGLAGGVGQGSDQLPTQTPAFKARTEKRAAHLLSEGSTTLRNCTLMMESSVLLPNAARWWLVATFDGSITLVDCTLRSAAQVGQGVLGLFDNAQALLRRCSAVDTKISGPTLYGRLGIVDSVFEPALDSAMNAIRPPDCGVRVAGELLCEPRADCRVATTGGIQCQCKGEGIEPFAGVRDDGSNCTTTRSLKMDIANTDARLFLRKSGLSNPMKLRNVATGDEGFNASYSRSTVLRRNNGSAVAQSDDGLHARVFGLAFEWHDALQAPSVAPIELDSAKQQYSATIEHAFTLSLQCGRNATTDLASDHTTCPQDGDTIETTIDFIPQKGGAPSTPSGANFTAQVRITTEVQAAVSCERTKPHVTVVADAALDSILPAAPLSVHLLAMDMDNLPVSFSPAELLLTWDGRAIPFIWLRGRNKYSWQIPPDRAAGEHEIVVSLKGSDACTLRRLTVTVTSDKTQMIVIGCIAGAAIVVLAVLAFLVWKNRDRAKELVFSLLSYEGLLTGEVCIEAWYARRGRTGLHCPHPCVSILFHSYVGTSPAIRHLSTLSKITVIKLGSTI
jgi:hypothetical protein